MPGIKLMLAVALSAVPALAQQSAFVFNNNVSEYAALPQVAGTDPQEPQGDGSSAQPQSEERMFHVMPAYGLVDAAKHQHPLFSGQKFKLSRQYFNPYTFLFIGVEAGFNQAANVPKEYGQGAEVTPKDMSPSWRTD